jgi:hypothetical protein
MRIAKVIHNLLNAYPVFLKIFLTRIERHKAFEAKSSVFQFLACVLLAVPLAAEAKIPRSREEVKAFRLENPCPSTGLLRGA